VQVTRHQDRSMDRPRRTVVRCERGVSAPGHDRG